MRSMSYHELDFLKSLILVNKKIINIHMMYITRPSITNLIFYFLHINLLFINLKSTCLQIDALFNILKSTKIYLTNKRYYWYRRIINSLYLWFISDNAWISLYPNKLVPALSDIYLNILVYKISN